MWFRCNCWLNKGENIVLYLFPTIQPIWLEMHNILQLAERLPQNVPREKKKRKFCLDWSYESPEN